MSRSGRTGFWQRVRQVLARRRSGTATRFRRLGLELFESRRLLDSKTIEPIADNTIFQPPGSTELSDGAGQFLFSGQAGFAAGIRRALLKFDVADNIPAGSHINSVSLTLHVSKTGSAATPEFDLHRLTANWGEGTSMAFGNEGQGTQAATNDATWNFSFFSTTHWNSAGGDFSGTISAKTNVAGFDTFPIWSSTQAGSAQMAADVQGWLDNPSTQFGWMLKENDESLDTSAKRFDSRQNSITANHPKLTINYTPGPPNAPPTLNTIGDANILEDAGQQTVDLTGISPGAGETQAVSITASSNNPGLIPNPTVIYSSPNVTGSLSYTSSANQSGTAIITVTVRDAGPDGIPNNSDDASLSRSFTVNVDPVNDPPTLNGISNPAAILEDAAQQTINLSGISSGPLESQALSVFAASSNPNLIPNPTVTYTSANATGSLSYTPVANQSGSAVITVTVQDDGGTANGGIDIITRIFTVNVTAVNDAPTLDSIANPPAILEDALLQTINLAGISPGPFEAAQTLTITATSSNTALIPNPTVNYTNSNPTGSLAYVPVANQSGSSIITVTVKDNGGTLNGGVDTFTRTFTVNVTAVNDSPTLNGIANPAAILEDAGQQTISLSGIAAGPLETQVLTVTATSSNPSLIPNPTVTYTSGSATGALAYTPVANQSGSAIITVSVKDDGGTANGGVDTVTRTFTVSVSPVNDQPTLAPISDPTAIPQDSGLQTIDLTGISAGPAESQTLLVTATSDNTALIPNPTVTYTSPSSTGSLTYLPVAGQNGSAVVTVTVRDAGLDGQPGNEDDATIVRTFTVQVTNPAFVNQPPSFVAGGDQLANDDSGAASVPAWATSISPGPQSEATQSIIFIVTADNTALFVVQPAVDAKGKLTFTPAPNAHGIAVVSVQAKDNGGTLNGGVDTSGTQTFNITISKPHPWHNSLNSLDVTGDRHVAPNDALAIINYINSSGSGKVPANAPFGPNYYDVNNDGSVAPNDVLTIINAINAGTGGEGEAAADSAAAADALFSALAEPFELVPGGARKSRWAL